MREHSKQSTLSSAVILLIAGLLGLLCAWVNNPLLNQACEIVSDVFIRLLKLVSIPIIFFSLLSTLTGMGGMTDARKLGSKIVQYTLLTTIIAAGLALILYIILDPSGSVTDINLMVAEEKNPVETMSYLGFLLSIIPSNIIEPFYHNNVIGVLFIALLLSAAVLSLGDEHKTVLHSLFASLFAAIMKMTSFILKLMPLAVWAFVTLFANELKNQGVLHGLTIYLVCILLANLIQALLVLPLFLKIKGISPWAALQAMWPALAMAFFTKSSSAALPSAVDCIEKRLGVSSRIARITMPLCITVNMNACAAFILITVLFVSQSNGIEYSTLELISWIFIATLAAIGNAGVPMGCYMLSSAFLSAMGVPLHLLVIILPFYAFIDMLESAINVWSDSCVTAVVDKDMQSTDQDTPRVTNNTS
ncbi:MAG: dicarboxylate/amino acid:cation symporter [Candidatus Endonucleobacter bathymodioli]|uniref:Dicarboxylate/amino acid:cation symporter n=1 Tax=Candidatus Endonucleibacter bathymodioli TaxID=539814 RepID=A0AA90NY98_9GAMM|nr:dicarboxylate/amino acid:cation symporter [Candidatus Endonucleobacter bathymodioli]